MERMKLVRLNEVQFADTAERLVDLKIAGFEVVETPKTVEEPKEEPTEQDPPRRKAEEAGQEGRRIGEGHGHCRRSRKAGYGLNGRGS